MMSPSIDYRINQVITVVESYKDRPIERVTLLGSILEGIFKQGEQNRTTEIRHLLGLD